MKTANNPNTDVHAIAFEKIADRRGHLKRWIIIIVVIVAAAAITAQLWQKFGKSNLIQYKTGEVRKGDVTVTVTATGNLEPTNEIEVGSELSGIIKTVDVDYNSKVKTGDVLAKLDTSKLDAQVTQSKAALESAKAKVLQVQATLDETRSKLAQYQKVRELSNNKVPSQTEYDAAKAAFERAKADEASATAAVAQASATLETYQTDLAKAVIRSPINGIVLTRGIEPGQTVAASFETPVLFKLAEDLTRMELHVDVDEADIGKVKEGQPATFTVDAYPDRTFKAQIIQTRYGSQTVDGVVTYETVLKVDNTDLSLRPGMTATADITVNKVEDAVLMPSAALRFTMPTQASSKSSRGLVGALLPGPPSEKKQEVAKSNGKKQQIWILKDGQPAAVSVSTGVTDGVSIEVLSDEIKPGMAVIVDTLGKGK